MKHVLRENRLIGLSISFFILLNFPILSIFNKESTLAGFPLLYIYFFSAWLLFIGLIAYLADSGKRKKD